MPLTPPRPRAASPGRPPSNLGALELAVLVALQGRAGQPALVAGARAFGRFGDHAAGWLALGAAGWLLDRERRRAWAAATAAVLGAHGTTVVVKRVLRRDRPQGVGLTVHARTPSRLSFPSSHAASTTAAAVAFGPLLGMRWAPAVLTPAMGASRLLLGLHFPSDVLAGTVVGALAGRMATRLATQQPTGGAR